ncbi:MAG: heme lyase CcmF/NrfE family subunit [Hyphomonadaceae bacterium]
MTAELGLFLCCLALTTALLQTAAGFVAGARRSAGLTAAAAAAAQAAVVLTLAAFALLVFAFVRSDFSLAVVANNSHTDKPLLYKIAGAWGNHEGSMLLWCAVSAMFGGVLASRRGELGETLWARALGAQGAVTGGALAYTIFLSSPFARLDPAPLQGVGLNPLLQDPALAAHPPMLYLGYVGLSVPYSLAIAALIEGKADAAWARAVRPWTLTAWTFLTVGIALGSYWAYYELGWGGWWFWDPVENASFMPWLAAAALLHSAIVTARRGSLASWTILLAILGFGFALLGTFLVRSGVLTSVHAFAVDSRRGIAVLALLSAALAAGFGLYAWRAPGLARPAGFTALSREGLLVLNNLGLSIACGTVLLGTIYPLLAQALGGRLVSVGPPYFNLTFAPLMAVVLAAVPIAPLLAWRRGDARAALRSLAFAAAAAVGAALGGVLLAHAGAWTAIGLALGAWLIAGAGAYLWKRARPARALRLPLAVWAMSLAHLGLGVFIIGAVAETAFKQETSALLTPGESVEFAGRRLRLVEVADREGPNYYADSARFDVDGRTLVAERRYYPTAPAPTTEVGILPSLGGDLYVALGEAARGGAGWTVRLYLNPLVAFIYAGAALMATGGVAALWGLARKRRRVEAGAAVAAP